MSRRASVSIRRRPPSSSFPPKDVIHTCPSLHWCCSHRNSVSAPAVSKHAHARALAHSRNLMPTPTPSQQSHLTPRERVPSQWHPVAIRLLSLAHYQCRLGLRRSRGWGSGASLRPQTLEPLRCSGKRTLDGPDSCTSQPAVSIRLVDPLSYRIRNLRFDSSGTSLLLFDPISPFFQACTSGCEVPHLSPLSRSRPLLLPVQSAHPYTWTPISIAANRSTLCCHRRSTAFGWRPGSANAAAVQLHKR